MKVIQHQNKLPSEGMTSAHEDVQNLAGKGPGLTLKWASLWAGSWTRWPEEAYSNLNSSIILTTGYKLQYIIASAPTCASGAKIVFSLIT